MEAGLGVGARSRSCSDQELIRIEVNLFDRPKFCIIQAGPSDSRGNIPPIVCSPGEKQSTMWAKRTQD